MSGERCKRLVKTPAISSRAWPDLRAWASTRCHSPQLKVQGRRRHPNDGQFKKLIGGFRPIAAGRIVYAPGAIQSFYWTNLGVDYLLNPSRWLVFALGRIHIFFCHTWFMGRLRTSSRQLFANHILSSRAASPRWIAGLLGHISTAMTLKYYAKIISNDGPDIMGMITAR